MCSSNFSRNTSPQTLTGSVLIARPFTSGDNLWISRRGDRLSPHTLPFCLTHPRANPLSDDGRIGGSGDCRASFTVAISLAFPAVLQTREYTGISRSGGRLPTRAISLGGPRPSVLFRKRLYSRHRKVEEGRRKRTDERKKRQNRGKKGGKKPLCGRND